MEDNVNSIRMYMRKQQQQHHSQRFFLLCVCMEAKAFPSVDLS